MTPLQFASLSNKPKSVEFLLNFGADPSIKDVTGRTAKDIAIFKEGKLVIQVFDQFELPKIKIDPIYFYEDEFDFKIETKDESVPIHKFLVDSFELNQLSSFSSVFFINLFLGTCFTF